MHAVPVMVLGSCTSRKKTLARLGERVSHVEERECTLVREKE